MSVPLRPGVFDEAGGWYECIRKYVERYSRVINRPGVQGLCPEGGFPQGKGTGGPASGGGRKDQFFR